MTQLSKKTAGAMSITNSNLVNQMGGVILADSPFHNYREINLTSHASGGGKRIAHSLEGHKNMSSET